MQHSTRESFVTELTLDPPQATGDLSGDPLLDEDYLVLSTVHSAKGQEWESVYVLNVTDGSFPSEFAAGRAELLEEEERWKAQQRQRQPMPRQSPEPQESDQDSIHQNWPERDLLLLLLPRQEHRGPDPSRW